MNRGRHSGGYTIVETLIFLAVSAALFLSAMGAISGKQGKTEFANTVREVEIKMQDIANDVSTGYYANPAVASGNNFLRCSPTSTGVTISSASGDRQGGNAGCIFIGKTVQFGINGAPDEYRLITLVGKRQFGTSGPDVSSFVESTVNPVASPPEAVDLTESAKYPPIDFVCVLYASAQVTLNTSNPCSTSNPSLRRTDNLTFMTTFVGINAATQNRDSDDTKVDLLVHQPPAAQTASLSKRATSTVAGEVKAYSNTSSPPEVNPVGGVYICMNSNSTRQYALIRIGGQGSRFGTDVKIESGRCE